MKRLSMEFKVKGNELIKKLEEMLFVLKKEWDALISCDFDLIWQYSKEKNEIFQELNSIKKELDKEVDDFVSEYNDEKEINDNEKWEIIRKYIHFSDYLYFDCFMNKYNTLKKEIILLNSHNMNWAKDQIDNISKILEIFIPKQESKNPIYSPQSIKNTATNKKVCYKGV